MNAQRLSELRAKVLHGTPGLTIDEQREVLVAAGAEPIYRRTRCPKCDASGEVIEGLAMQMIYPPRSEVLHGPCPRCNGAGYEVAGVY